MRPTPAPGRPGAGRVGRFAPSTTGLAHPGTLMAALIAWLDAAHVGGRCLLRLEDLDPIRSTRGHVDAMRADLAWLGLPFAETALQSEGTAHHHAALDTLAERGLLYACGCSRRDIAERGVLLPDGSRRYPGTCRSSAPLDAAGWRAARVSVRARLDAVADGSGDPVVRRRDGAVPYLLACVVDDAVQGVTDVVRGRDLEGQAPVQRALGAALGLPRPAYRHHLLLLEPRGDKLAKLHGSMPSTQLRPLAPPAAWLGMLAHLAGIVPTSAPTTLDALRVAFRWEHLCNRDKTVALIEGRLIEVDPRREP